VQSYNVLLCRDAAAANISLKGNDPWQAMAVADAWGPHFAIMRDAIQSAWRLEGSNGKALPVLPSLLPGGQNTVPHSLFCI
jgi:hypothetical protein